MEPHHNRLQELTWRDINDAVGSLRIENPGLDAESLPLSELLRMSKRSNPYRSRTMHNTIQTKLNQVSYGEDENDGDDEYEDDAEETHLRTEPPLPSPPLSKPLPPRPRSHSPTLPNEPHDFEHHPPTLLQKGSDGLHDTPNSPFSHYNSIFGGPRLSTIHAQIKQAIPSHTTAQIKLLRQRHLAKAVSKRKAKLARAAPKRLASPPTSSTKGSPLPWPTSPHTPTDDTKNFPLHQHTTPSSPLTQDQIRTQSASPQPSRTLLRKQKAHLSTPIPAPDPPAPQPLPPDAGADSGPERGRTRLRKEKPASRNEHDDGPRGKEGLKISRPMLQHPILIPVVSLEVASGMVSPGKVRVGGVLVEGQRVGAPLVEEQRESGTISPEDGFGVQKSEMRAQDEGLMPSDAREVESGVGRVRRHAVLLGGMLDMGTRCLLDEEIFWRAGPQNDRI